ncbi:type II secretion system F family protein [Roseococcus sp. DSY-14]|uniref:type II secretion system F family protein n=1 Tax=Roseococcus sp. DSY-14 TaxID=3369650 RepID=UPI00387AD75A
MSAPPLLLLGPALLLAVLGALLLHGLGRQRRLGARLLLVRQRAGAPAPPPRRPRDLALDALRAGGRVLTGRLLSARTVAEMRATLAGAGFHGEGALALLAGAKLACLAGLPALALGASALLGLGAGGTLLAAAGAATAGLLLPEMAARRLRRRHLRALERGLPDALDLMVICAEAGLTLETAIGRVAADIGGAHPAVAAEFGLCDSELRILPHRDQALANMARRTGLETMARLSVTLAQSLRYGTPLVQALRTLAAELRGEQLTRFEERAARLPVLLTLPMIGFILPTLVIVAAGPALIEVMKLWR